MMAARGKPLAFDLRMRIKKLLGEHSQRTIARVLGVSRNTVRKYCKRV